MRALNRTPDATYAPSEKESGIGNSKPEIAANVILGLVRVTCYLLAQKITALERAFLAGGGLREGMTRARLRKRNARGAEN
jgi:four helix bundle suffix protein